MKMMTMLPDQKDRKDWMGLLARAKPEKLALLLRELPPYDLLRAPEVGAVMVRGRIGGTGLPFNLGEMTVTRCVLRLRCGTIGHANVQGRDKAHALRAATVDALLQTDQSATVRETVLTPLAEAEAAKRNLRAAKAAATKVEFFTLVRGEDK